MPRESVLTELSVKLGDLKNVKDGVEGQSLSATAPDSSVRKATPLHYAADFGQGSFEAR